MVTVGAAKANAEPRVSTAASATAVAHPAAANKALTQAPTAEEAVGARTASPLDVEGGSPQGPRSHERHKGPALYHRKVGHGPCGIFRCVGNHRPTNYMIVRMAAAP